MSHLDPELLALLALGEHVGSDDDRAHLSECRACAEDLAEMSHTVTVARSAVDEKELENPAPRVWEGIAAELGLASAVDPFASVPVSPVEPAGAPPAPVPEPEPEYAPAAVAPETDDAPAAVAPGAEPASEAAPALRPRRERRTRRRSRLLWTLAASLVVVTAAGTGIWIATARTVPTAIAAAVLDAFPDHALAAGTAEVDEDGDGARTLTVTLNGDEVADDYREVWLIRNDGKALISLGLLDGETGAFPIPAGVDLREYDLVDISVEPVDGDPAHSGDSIVRGQLSFDPDIA